MIPLLVYDQDRDLFYDGRFSFQFLDKDDNIIAETGSYNFDERKFLEFFGQVCELRRTYVHARNPGLPPNPQSGYVETSLINV